MKIKVYILIMYNGSKLNAIVFDKKKESQEELIELFNSLSFEINIERVADSNEFIKRYQSSSYDIVFIVFNSDLSSKLLQKVMRMDPRQKIVSINNNLECSGLISCKYCKSETNNFRMFQPFTINDIIKVIKNEKCEIDYCDGSEVSKLYIIAKTINSFSFIKKSYRFVTSTSYKDILNNPNLLDLVSILNKNKIQYTIDENFVQIQPSFGSK